MQRLQRLIRMIDLINRGRCPTREQFCEEFECKRRTVDEDIRFLKEDLNLSIEFDRFKGGYVNTDPKQKLPEFDLDPGEVLALTVGKDMLSEYSGTAFEPILKSALDKIADRLPEKVRVNLAELVSVVRFKPSGIAPVSRKTFFDFSEACDETRLVEMQYFSPHSSESTSRIIEPYRLLENRGAWYCIAWCRLRNDVRMFALHRVEKYNLLAETFSVRAGLNLDAYVSEAFLLEHGDPPEKYVINFDASSAPYVRERNWHPTQEITNHSDGSCTMSFVAVNMGEVKRWVLTYGASAVVIEPKNLRDLMCRELEQAHSRYSNASKS